MVKINIHFGERKMQNLIKDVFFPSAWTNTIIHNLDLCKL